MFTARMLRTRDTPVRVAFASLVGSHRFWAGFVLVLPLIAIVAALSHRAFVPLAAGVPLVISLFLQGVSHAFARPRFAIDSGDRTISVSKPFGRGTYRPIDAADVEQASVVPLYGMGVVKLRFSVTNFFKPSYTAVDAAEVADLERELGHVGIDVRVDERNSGLVSLDAVRVRLIATPVAIGGSAVAVYRLFGPDAFWTDAVIVPALVMIALAVYSRWRRYSLSRPDPRSNGVSS